MSFPGFPRPQPGNFFTGSKGRYNQLPLYGPEQAGLYNQLQGAASGQPGAGGAFGQAADYYSSLFNDQNNTYNAFAAPEMRQFHEQIIPGLAEQFAGMGSGGLSSSGFRNAAVSAGTDLSERLGAIRASLRQQGAQGLMGLGQQGLQPYYENTYETAKPGFLDALSQGAGKAIGQAGGYAAMGAFLG